MPQRKSPAHFAKQAQEAYELSIAGYSQRQIAEKMGVALATVQKRLALYIEGRTMPKADEYRTKQIARLEVYIRSLWSQINAGDPKAIAAAVRTEERIAKLMGTDSATAFVVKADVTNRETDALEVQRHIDEFFGRNAATKPKTIPGEVVTSEGYTRLRRPLKKSEPIKYASTPADEFRHDNTFQPHEVHKEAVTIAEDIEEPEPAPRPRRKGKPVPNPADQFLRDSDDD
jgi:hypothetical protein